MAGTLKFKVLFNLTAAHKRTVFNMCTRIAAPMIQCRSICTPTLALRSDIKSFRTREEQRDREQDTEPLSSSTQEGTRTGAESAAKRERVAAVRTQILAAALEHVPELGWSREALEAGAASVQLPSIVHGLFPGGGFELVEYFTSECDRRLVEHLTDKAQQELLTTATPSSGGIRAELAFVSSAIRYRLELLDPLLGVWPQALGLRVMPQNAPVALTQLMRMVDDICYHAGDRSVDLQWYTRRAAIGSLYKLTELHLLQDKSAGHQDTWEFLQRRICELNWAQSTLGGSDQTVQNVFAAVRSVCDTVRNLSGIPMARV